MSRSSDPLVHASAMASFEHTPGGLVRCVSGHDHGVELTVALSQNPSGGGAAEHRHSCGEAFVVVEGCGIYTVDGTEVRAEAGDAVFIPAHTWHSFRAADGEVLRHVAVFEVGDVQTEGRSD